MNGTLGMIHIFGGLCVSIIFCRASYTMLCLVVQPRMMLSMLFRRINFDILMTKRRCLGKTCNVNDPSDFQQGD